MGADAKRRWRERNPEKVRAAQAARNAKRRAASPVGVVHIEMCERCRDGFVYVHQGKRRRLCDPCRDHQHEWQKFGLTGPQAIAFRERAACDICGGFAPHGRGDWHIDHDHQTGTLRGLLCGHCNAAIGMLQDNPEVIRKAADYVERHKQSALTAASRDPRRRLQTA